MNCEICHVFDTFTSCMELLVYREISMNFVCPMGHIGSC